MSEPFIYIGTYKLKEGKLEAFKQTCGGLAESIESNEPRMIAFNVDSNEEGTEASVARVHPDAESRRVGWHPTRSCLAQQKR
jgi:hypothetical protein